MPIEFTWDDDAQTILRYTARGQWNWMDYHKTVRMSIFPLINLDHTVDVIIDLSQSDKIPGGAIGHVRSFAKRHHANLSGHAIVIGLPLEIERSLIGERPERRMTTGDQTLYFANDAQEAQAILKALPHRQL